MSNEKEEISTNKFLSELNRKVNKYESRERAAKYFGVSASFLRAVLKGSELPGKKILDKMKLSAVKHVNYRYKRGVE